MKKTIIPLYLCLLIGSISCTNIKKGEAQNDKQKVNLIINKYDPVLSSIQGEYRLWLEDFTKINNDEDLLAPNRMSDISYINNHIDALSNAIDTIKKYLKDIAFTSSDYGDELASTISDPALKLEFQAKWREYGEGVSLVMAYDIESIVHLLDIFYFLRDNRTKYEIQEDMYYFIDEEPENKFIELLNVITNSKVVAKQETARINTINAFSTAIGIVKQ